MVPIFDARPLRILTLPTPTIQMIPQSTLATKLIRVNYRPYTVANTALAITPVPNKLPTRTQVQDLEMQYGAHKVLK